MSLHQPAYSLPTKPVTESTKTHAPAPEAPTATPSSRLSKLPKPWLPPVSSLFAEPPQITPSMRLAPYDTPAPAPAAPAQTPNIPTPRPAKQAEPLLAPTLSSSMRVASHARMIPARATADPWRQMISGALDADEAQNRYLARLAGARDVADTVAASSPRHDPANTSTVPLRARALYDPFASPVASLRDFDKKDFGSTYDLTIDEGNAEEEEDDEVFLIEQKGDASSFLPGVRDNVLS